METTDGALVARARAGDTVAFDTLVDRYYGDCLRYATRMLGNRADAEEAVQDTFVRVYRSLGRYHDRDAFRSWLFRILVNRCRSLAGRRSRAWALLARFQRDAWPRASSGVAPPEVAGGEVERALRALPAEQREALLLKYLEELSYPEMAEMTGAGVSALKMRVKRACERLAELLREVDHG